MTDHPVADGLREVADVVAQLEQSGVRVSDVDPTTWSEAREDGYLPVRLVVGVPVDGTLDEAETAATPTADGDDAADEDTPANECPECGERFAGSRGVAVHRSKAHSDEDEDEDEDGDEEAPAEDEVDADAAEGNDIYGDTDREWCGYCGAGPFKSVAHHNGRAAEHPADPVVLDHAPTDDELVGEPATDTGDDLDGDAEADSEPESEPEPVPEPEAATTDGGAVAFSDFANQSGDVATDPLNYKTNEDLREDITAALDLDWDADRTVDSSTEFLNEDLVEIVVAITDWTHADFDEQDEPPTRQQLLEIICRALDAEPESYTLSRRTLKPLHREVVDGRPGGGPR